MKVQPQMKRLGVPVIDMAVAPAELERQIHQACVEWGFFQVVGHDIGPRLRVELVAQAQAFFVQTPEEKNRIRRSAENPWGYFDAELTKNTPDWKEIVDIGPERGTEVPQWPRRPEAFQDVMQRYRAAADALARELTRLVLANLGDAQAAQLRGFDSDTSFLRLNQYPICPNPAPSDLSIGTPASDEVGRLGISHHSDAGALTVLHQDGPPGLQVFRDTAWHTVDVMEDALVINIGDVAQVWSNDLYRAPLHRVLANSSLPRSSAAYFFNPDYSYDYAPLVDDQLAKYRPINWGMFRAGRAAGDYADEGEEIQISHFHINNK